MQLYIATTAALPEAETSGAIAGLIVLAAFIVLIGHQALKDQQRRRLVLAAQTWRDRKSQLRLSNATFAEWENWRAEGQELLTKLRKIEDLRTNYRNEMNNVEADLRLYEASRAGSGKA